MANLERVEKMDGAHGERGWLKDGKRHGLWIDQHGDKFTLTMYDDGEPRTSHTIAPGDPRPFPASKLFSSPRSKEAPQPAPPPRATAP